MLNVGHKMRLASLRKVLLLGIFAGLVFSCAEGIRLFPFPPPDAFQGLVTIGHDRGGPARHSYAKGLENGGGGAVSRSKPEAHSHFPGAVAKAALPRFLALVLFEDDLPEFRQTAPVTVSAARLPDKRGPPVFFNI